MSMTPDPSIAKRHDSGCRNKMPLPVGVNGSATFRGDRHEHRIHLERWWDGSTEGNGPFALWIGMNPSAAEADVDDLTIRKECHFTKLLNYSRYVKVNAGSYRLTDSAAIDAVRAPLSHPDNLSRILYLARQAGVIVLATGSPPNALVPYARSLFRELKTIDARPLCLGITRDGWPKHSSRLAYATPFTEYRL